LPRPRRQEPALASVALLSDPDDDISSGASRMAGGTELACRTPKDHKHRMAAAPSLAEVGMQPFNQTSPECLAFRYATKTPNKAVECVSEQHQQRLQIGRIDAAISSQKKELMQQA